MGQLAHGMLSHRLNQPQPVNMPVIMETLRNGKPLPVTTKKSVLYRIIRNPKHEGITYGRPVGWKFPDQDYVMSNIRAAARLNGLDTHAHAKLWLRNGAFCPFAVDCVPPDDFNQGNLYDFFLIKLQRLTSVCDWREVDNPNREKAEV